MTKEYSFDATVWIYPGDAAWHFITLPTDVAQDIDYYFGMYKRGFGSLPVVVTVGETTWKTSIFPDKAAKSYILPLKAAVREKEKIRVSQTISLSITLQT